MPSASTPTYSSTKDLPPSDLYLLIYLFTYYLPPWSASFMRARIFLSFLNIYIFQWHKGARSFCLFYGYIPKCLEERVTPSRPSIHICWLNKCGITCCLVTLCHLQGGWTLGHKGDNRQRRRCYFLRWVGETMRLRLKLLSITASYTLGGASNLIQWLSALLKVDGCWIGHGRWRGWNPQTGSWTGCPTFKAEFLPQETSVFALEACKMI